MKAPAWIKTLVGYPDLDRLRTVVDLVPVNNKPMIPPTAGRSSRPTAIVDHQEGFFPRISANRVVIGYNFLRQIIPAIRKLSMMNPVISQVIYDVTALGNTGYRIHFDPSVTPEQADEMRTYINEASKGWAPGQAGMHGLINKMVAQELISGAIATEWVPNNELTGIKACRILNPESIFFEYDISKDAYIAYQKQENTLLGLKFNEVGEQLIKLNPYTFRYFALNGDTEIPYGFPPYLASVEPLRIQKNMNNNIDFLVDTMGLVGFLEVLLNKPEDGPVDGNETAYIAEMEDLLLKAKNRVMAGMKDGVVVGFKDDHEFEFHSLSKNGEGAAELFKVNDIQVASGVKTDPVLMGRDYNTSETQITVVFNKMIASLRNIQINVGANLAFGFDLALRLAGFSFKYIKVSFNRSTIQDDYKYQQAEEIKIRNVVWKYVMGMINQDQAAEELGYDVPAVAKPLVDPEILVKGSVPTEPKKEVKGKSAKKSRDTAKPISKDKPRTSQK